MARIPDSVLAQLKRLDLVELIGHSGVELKRQGRNWSGLCPLHSDSEPSLRVTPAKGLWRCFGCERGGSPIDWVMVTEGLSFREAAQKLQRAYLPDTLDTETADPTSAEPVARPNAETAQESLIPPGCSDDEADARMVAFYHQELLASEKALEYLASRGLGDSELIERFGLGFANRQLGLRLPLGQIQAGQEVRAQLKRLGFLREKTGHEHLTGRVVVPILDLEGKLQQMYGRAVQKIKGGPPHLYLSRPLDCVFHPEALLESREVILCESPLDALTFWASGFRAVTTSFGKGNFPPALLAAMQEHGTKRVLIAYDNDSKSNPAAKQVAERLLGRGIEAFRVRFPKGMDANEYALKVQPARQSLDLVLRKAEWMGEGPGPSVAVPELSPPERVEQPPPILREPQEPAEPTNPAPVAAPASDSPPQQPHAGAPVDLVFGSRLWRVRSWEKNLSHEKLQVVLRVSVAKGAFFVDSVDLVQSKQRQSFLRSASAELEVDEPILKKDLAQVHLRIEELQERLIAETLSPQSEEPERMSAVAEQTALEYLRAPGLLRRILEDFARCGIVGEETNKLTGYLAAVSRKLMAPLAVIVQSSSAAGKSSLMEAILSLVPEEDRVQYSAMTGQSLYYLGETDLRHKILAIVEEEGAERASYALKLLQSEGELTIASTGKDPATGRLLTQEYRVEGPVMLFLTTTSVAIDEELLNRCLVLSVDESREQTRAIHQQQRERRTLEGLLQRRERSRVLELHRNAQRLLRALPVVNPYAPQLTFLDQQTRMRRDHEKYLTLIEAITLLHQHQRTKKKARDSDGEVFEYLEVELEDIEVANRLAGEVFGHSLDELPPQTRRFLSELEEIVDELSQREAIDREDLRFSRRAISEQTGWSLTQVRTHLARLCEHEMVLMHRSRRGQSFEYELLWRGEGKSGERFLSCLIDVESLRDRPLRPEGHEYDAQVAAPERGVAEQNAEVAERKRPENGGVAARWRRGDAQSLRAVTEERSDGRGELAHG